MLVSVVHQSESFMHMTISTLFLFWPCYIACGILVPWPGIEPTPPALEVWSLSPLDAREVLQVSLDEKNIRIHSFTWLSEVTGQSSGFTSCSTDVRRVSHSVKSCLAVAWPVSQQVTPQSPLWEGQRALGFLPQGTLGLGAPGSVQVICLTWPNLATTHSLLCIQFSQEEPHW